MIWLAGLVRPIGRQWEKDTVLIARADVMRCTCDQTKILLRVAFGLLPFESGTIAARHTTNLGDVRKQCKTLWGEDIWRFCVR